MAVVLVLGAGCKSKGDATPPAASTSSVSATRPPTPTVSRYKAREVTNGKGIAVRVEFTGKPRSTTWTLADHFKEHCGTTAAPDGSLKVGEGGGLDDAVVWLDDITEGAATVAATVVQDQKGCVFTPHVLAAAAGSTLRLTNSDPAVHQVRLDFGGGDVLTKTIAPGGSSDVIVRADWAGKVANVMCPIHLWMWSYVHVFDHPYFAVTKVGAAKLEDVPPGRYHLSVWHEGIGPTYKNELSLPPPATARVPVTVEKDDVKLTFTLDDAGKLAAR